MTYSETFIKLMVIFFLTSVIGLEREYKGKPAGLRTHILIGLGACMFTTLSLDYIIDHPEAKLDILRTVGAIISGVGFLGAGTIMKDGFGAQGLTNAANIWTTSALGILVGLGEYVTAFILWLFIVFTLYILSKMKFLFVGALKTFQLEIDIVSKAIPHDSIAKFIRDNEAIIEKKDIHYADDRVTIVLKGKIQEKYKAEDLVSNLDEYFNVKSFSLDML